MDLKAIDVVDDGSTNFLEVDSYVNKFEREVVEDEEEEKQNSKDDDVDLVLPSLNESLFERWIPLLFPSPFEEELIWSHMIVEKAKVQKNSFLLFQKMKIGPDENTTLYDEAKRLGTYQTILENTRYHN
jgi:hypothetical protein